MSNKLINPIETGDGVLIECYDFSKAVPYPDSFSLSVYSKELIIGYKNINDNQSWYYIISTF